MVSITTGWQVISLCGIALWIMISSKLKVTQKLRSCTQPWVCQRVISGTPIIIKIQKYQHRCLDAFFSGLSCVVSVPFYTAFLPLLFWTGHCKLARQMTLLIAFCDYTGNCIKDVVSAPRPISPPVGRGIEVFLHLFPKYLLHYILDYTERRIYLGMHSLIDIIGGLALGLGTLAVWLSVSEYIDNFIVYGQNGKSDGSLLQSMSTSRFEEITGIVSFWAALCFLLLFAYPTPEVPTPSFEYHTAFNGVSLGIVSVVFLFLVIGIHQTFHQFHHEDVARVFSPQLMLPAFVGRLLLGIPTILLVKFCSKALAKWILPIISNTLGIPVRSTSYIPTLNATDKKSDVLKQSGYLQKMFSKQTSFDVDTGIRLLQYAGLAWSVVDLVPSMFLHIGL
ncbi:hypothetical protein SASPL_129064 [Salvia splendens]|uniref:Sphingosine-1-phosphate phosphatase 1 n=1 Tax=Salvia splendens TaxID=180675 RepID=A0A8X8XC41_SALSN|nr:hypothetical protein SASPL_129064 [Salvia splendens]